MKSTADSSRESARAHGRTGHRRREQKRLEAARAVRVSARVELHEREHSGLHQDGLVEQRRLRRAEWAPGVGEERRLGRGRRSRRQVEATRSRIRGRGRRRIEREIALHMRLVVVAPIRRIRRRRRVVDHQNLLAIGAAHFYKIEKLYLLL